MAAPPKTTILREWVFFIAQLGVQVVSPARPPPSEAFYQVSCCTCAWRELLPLPARACAGHSRCRSGPRSSPTPSRSSSSSAATGRGSSTADAYWACAQCSGWSSKSKCGLPSLLRARLTSLPDSPLGAQPAPPVLEPSWKPSPPLTIQAEAWLWHHGDLVEQCAVGGANRFGTQVRKSHEHSGRITGPLLSLALTRTRCSCGWR